MVDQEKDKQNVQVASGLNDGLGSAGAVMPCGAIVTNVYEAYEAGIKAERERCARLCLYIPYGTGLAGRTFAEAIKGEGLGAKLAEGFDA